MKTQKQRLAAFLFAALVMVSTTLPMAAPRVANFTYLVVNLVDPGAGANWQAYLLGGLGLGSLIAPGVGTVIGAFAGL